MRSGPEILPAEVMPEPGRAVALPVEIADAYSSREKAESTMQAYRSHAPLFDAWCRANGFKASPASPEAVIGFLTA
jgi:hypothetical protein